MKRFNVLVIVLSLIATISVFTATTINGFLRGMPDMIEFVPGDPPQVESLNLAMPDLEDEQAKISFASNLYKLACENWKELDYASFHVRSVNEMFKIPVLGFRYQVKNHDKLYYIEYSFIPQQDGAAAVLGLIMGEVSKESTKFALATYTDKTMENVYGRRVVDPTPQLNYNLETNENTYEVDWKAAVVEIKDKPIYYKEQEEEYRQTEIVITEDTILQASIKKVEKDADNGLPMGYWEIQAEVDPSEDKGTADVIKSLRAGAGDGAHYTKLVQTYQIWENGYFRYFKAEDTWSGGPLGSGATLIFETFFQYDEDFCDIGNYQYMNELEQIAKSNK